jgi:hypothetical protein
LDKEITIIQKEKEKRDRIGFITSSVVANVNVNFKNLIRDDQESSKQFAS